MTFGVQSEEFWDRCRFDGRLDLRESEGNMSGIEGVVGGVENVSLSGDSIESRTSANQVGSWRSSAKICTL